MLDPGFWSRGIPGEFYEGLCDMERRLFELTGQHVIRKIVIGSDVASHLGLAPPEHVTLMTPYGSVTVEAERRKPKQ